MSGIIGPCGAYRTVQDEGVALTRRRTLNFVGDGVTATDDAGNAVTLVTIPGGGTPAVDYASRVAAIGNLVSYWRMGAASGNQPDTAANPLGDKDLVLQSGSTAGTWDITGADQLVENGDDDGAWRSNRNQTVASEALNLGDYFLATDNTNHRWAFNAGGANAYTVSFFFYWTSGWSIPVGNLIPIIGTDPGSGTASGWAILAGFNAGTSQPTLWYERGNGGASTLVIGPVLALDTWLHVAVSYTGTNTTIYIDGAPVYFSTTATGISAQDTIRVAGGAWAGAAQGHIYGALDEIAVFSAALTDAEIASLALASDPAAVGVVSVTGTYTIGAYDDVVLGNGTFTVTLPTAVGITGRTIIVKNTGAGTVTVGRTSSQTIDGVAANVTLTAGKARHFTSDGSGWQITAAYL